MPEIEIAPQTNIKELVAQLPIAAEVLTAFGLGCSGCGVSKYENVEQGARAHGLRVEPIVDALKEARRSGSVPKIAEESRRPAARAPGAFSGRTKFAHTIPIMSGKGGVGKSLVTALLAVGLRRKNYRVGIIDADITGPSIPRLFGLHRPLQIDADPVKTTPQGQPQPLMHPAVTRSAIEVVSSNLFIGQEDKAMIWRGPIVASVIRRILRTGALERTRFLARGSSAGHIRRTADRLAVAEHRRSRARYDAASSGDDDRAQGG